MPFSDGISGWFDIEAEAMTPVFIRHGEKPPGWHKDSPEDVDRLREQWLQVGNPVATPQPEDDWIEFFNVPAGHYAIPGTSMKGTLRHILEIVSFGKFPPSVGGRMLRRGDAKRGIKGIEQSEVQERSQNSSEFAVRWDLAETLFGRAEQTESHRGRVAFEPLALTLLPETPRPVIWPVLQTPKGMFAPNYAEQPHVTDQASGWTPRVVRWEDGDAHLRGWKLYPRTLTVRACPEPPPARAALAPK